MNTSCQCSVVSAAASWPSVAAPAARWPGLCRAPPSVPARRCWPLQSSFFPSTVFSSSSSSSSACSPAPSASSPVCLQHGSSGQVGGAGAERAMHGTRRALKQVSADSGYPLLHSTVITAVLKQARTCCSHQPTSPTAGPPLNSLPQDSPELDEEGDEQHR